MSARIGHRDGYYRLYRLDSENRIIGLRELFCADDERAIMWVEDGYDGCPAELWSCDRLVERFGMPDAGPQQHGSDRQNDTTPRPGAAGTLVKA